MMCFDKKRAGTVLGDGGALMMMETLESAEKRGAKIYCEILSYHTNCHGKHPTSPDENGHDSYYTLRESMVTAGVKPSEIDMVNCHASSTIVGDISEARGVRNIFGNKNTYDSLENLKKIEAKDIKEEDIDKELLKRVPVTAIKGNFGHS
jgi:3-oxoacyl-(acyl-carrier-protein) synthase